MTGVISDAMPFSSSTGTSYSPLRRGETEGLGGSRSGGGGKGRRKGSDNHHYSPFTSSLSVAQQKEPHHFNVSTSSSSGKTPLLQRIRRRRSSIPSLDIGETEEKSPQSVAEVSTIEERRYYHNRSQYHDDCKRPLRNCQERLETSSRSTTGTSETIPMTPSRSKHNRRSSSPSTTAAMGKNRYKNNGKLPNRCVERGKNGDRSGKNSAPNQRKIGGILPWALSRGKRSSTPAAATATASSTTCAAGADKNSNVSGGEGIDGGDVITLPLRSPRDPPPPQASTKSRSAISTASQKDDEECSILRTYSSASSTAASSATTTSSTDSAASSTASTSSHSSGHVTTRFESGDEAQQELPRPFSSSSVQMEDAANNPSLGNSVHFLSLVGPGSTRREEIATAMNGGNGGGAATNVIRAGGGFGGSSRRPPLLFADDDVTMGGGPPRFTPSSVSMARDRLRETIESTFHLKYPAAFILDDNLRNDHSSSFPFAARGDGNVSNGSSAGTTDKCAGGSNTSGDLSSRTTTTAPLFEINRTNEKTVHSLSHAPGRRGQTGPVDVDDVILVDAEHNLQDILFLAKKHVVLREFDDALDVYANLLENQRSTLRSLQKRRGEGADSSLQPRKDRRRDARMNGECRRILWMWIGSILHNLAVASNLKRDHASAVRYAEEAVSARKRTREGLSSTADAANAMVLTESLVELGLSYYATGKFGQALGSLREALRRICQRLPYDTTPMVARILNVIGCVHFEMGQLLSAAASFEESLDIQRSALSSSSMQIPSAVDGDGAEEDNGGDFVEDFPRLSANDSDFTLLNVSTTLLNISFLHWRRGGIEDAISSAEEALILQESVLGDGDWIGGNGGSAMVQNTSAFISFLTRVQDHKEASGHKAYNGVDKEGRRVDSTDDGERSETSSKSCGPDDHVHRHDDNDGTATAMFECSPKAGDSSISFTRQHRRSSSARSASVSFVASFKERPRYPVFAEDNMATIAHAVDDIATGNSGGNNEGGLKNNSVTIGGPVEMMGVGADLTATISTHYIFHSISCISLGSLEGAPYPSSPASSSSRSAAAQFPTETDRVECQNLLRDSVQACLKAHGSRVEGSAPDFDIAAEPFCPSPSRGMMSSPGSWGDANTSFRRPHPPPSLSDVHFPSVHKTAIRHLLRGEYTEALVLYQNVLLALQSSCDPSEEVFAGVAGMAFHHLGMVFLYAEEYDDAKTMFHKAGEFRMASCQKFSSSSTNAATSINNNDGGDDSISSLSTDDKDAAYFAASVSLANLAISHFLLSQYEDAVLYFSQSLRFLRQVPSTPWINTHVSQVWNNVACAHVCMGRAGRRPALSAFSLGLSSCPRPYKTTATMNTDSSRGENGNVDDAAEHVTADPSVDEDVNRVRSRICTNKGYLQVRLREYAEAIVTLEEALRCINDMEDSTSFEKGMVVENLAYAMACANSPRRRESRGRKVRRRGKAGSDGVGKGDAELRSMMEMYKEMLLDAENDKFLLRPDMREL